MHQGCPNLRQDRAKLSWKLRWNSSMMPAARIELLRSRSAMTADPFTQGSDLFSTGVPQDFACFEGFDLPELLRATA